MSRVVIIGGGPGGYESGLVAAQLGAEVTVVESDGIGGSAVLTLAQKWDLTADEVARNVFAHPTLSEAVKEAVHGIAGHMINF